VFQCVSVSVFQYFSISVFQYFSISVFQYFSISVFQYFSISVFQYFSISAFQHFSISAFCFLLSAFQVSGLKSHPSSFPLSDGPIVHGLWSMVFGLMTQHFSISAFQHFSV